MYGRGRGSGHGASARGSSAGRMTHQVNRAHLEDTKASVNISVYQIKDGGGLIRLDFRYSEAIMAAINDVGTGWRNDVQKCTMFKLEALDDVIKAFEKYGISYTAPSSGLPGFVKSIWGLQTEPLESRLPPSLYSKLLPHQLMGIEFVVKRRGRALIADEMGVGKTLQAVGCAAYYKADWPLLVVTLAGMRDEWERELTKYFDPSCVFCVMKSKDIPEMVPPDCAVILSYSMLSQLVDKLGANTFGVAILDESHSIKSKDSKQTKAALPILHCAKRVVLLSGTPQQNRPIEMFTQLNALHPMLFKNYHEFGRRYCDGKLGNYGYEYKGASHQDEMAILLSELFMVRRLKEDVIKVPEKKQRCKIIHVPKERLSYLINSRKSLDEIGQKLTASGNSSERLKMSHQQRLMITQMYHASATAKVDTVVTWLKENLINKACKGGPRKVPKTLVFAHHREMVVAITNAVKSSELDYIKISGETPSSERQPLVDKFQNDEDCRIAVLTIKSSGTGITLTRARQVIFTELSWTPADISQAVARAHRMGQKHNLLVTYLIAPGTVDEIQLKMIQSKIGVIEQSMAVSDNMQQIAMHDSWSTDLDRYLESSASQPSSVSSPSAKTQPTPGSHRKPSSVPMATAGAVESYDHFFDGIETDDTKEGPRTDYGHAGVLQNKESNAGVATPYDEEVTPREQEGIENQASLMSGLNDMMCDVQQGVTSADGANLAAITHVEGTADRTVSTSMSAAGVARAAEATASITTAGDAEAHGDRDCTARANAQASKEGSSGEGGAPITGTGVVCGFNQDDRPVEQSSGVEGSVLDSCSVGATLGKGYQVPDAGSARNQTVRRDGNSAGRLKEEIGVGLGTNPKQSAGRPAARRQRSPYTTTRSPYATTTNNGSESRASCVGGTLTIPRPPARSAPSIYARGAHAGQDVRRRAGKERVTPSVKANLVSNDFTTLSEHTAPHGGASSVDRQVDGNQNVTCVQKDGQVRSAVLGSDTGPKEGRSAVMASSSARSGSRTAGPLLSGGTERDLRESEKVLPSQQISTNRIKARIHMSSTELHNKLDDAGCFGKISAVSLPNLVSCPLGMSLMVDPVRCSDGFTYERVNISTWLEKYGTSPMSRTPCHNTTLSPDEDVLDHVCAFLVHGRLHLPSDGRCEECGWRSQKMAGQCGSDNQDRCTNVNRQTSPTLTGPRVEEEDMAMPIRPPPETEPDHCSLIDPPASSADSAEWNSWADNMNTVLHVPDFADEENDDNGCNKGSEKGASSYRDQKDKRGESFDRIISKLSTYMLSHGFSSSSTHCSSSTRGALAMAAHRRRQSQKAARSAKKVAVRDSATCPPALAKVNQDNCQRSSTAKAATTQLGNTIELASAGPVESRPRHMQPSTVNIPRGEHSPNGADGVRQPQRLEEGSNEVISRPLVHQVRTVDKPTSESIARVGSSKCAARNGICQQERKQPDRIEPHSHDSSQVGAPSGSKGGGAKVTRKPKEGERGARDAIGEQVQSEDRKFLTNTVSGQPARQRVVVPAREGTCSNVTIPPHASPPPTRRTGHDDAAASTPHLRSPAPRPAASHPAILPLTVANVQAHLDKMGAEFGAKANAKHWDNVRSKIRQPAMGTVFDASCVEEGSGATRRRDESNTNANANAVHLKKRRSIYARATGSKKKARHK